MILPFLSAILISLYSCSHVLGARVSSPWKASSNLAINPNPKCVLDPSWTEPRLDRADCLTILLHWERHVLERYGDEVLEFLAQGARGRSRRKKQTTPLKYVHGEHGPLPFSGRAFNPDTLTSLAWFRSARVL